MGRDHGWCVAEGGRVGQLGWPFRPSDFFRVSLRWALPIATMGQPVGLLALVGAEEAIERRFFPCRTTPRPHDFRLAGGRRCGGNLAMLKSGQGRGFVAGEWGGGEVGAG